MHDTIHVHVYLANIYMFSSVQAGKQATSWDLFNYENHHVELDGKLIAAQQKRVCSRLNQNKCRYCRSCKAPISVYSLIVVLVKNLQLGLAQCHIFSAAVAVTQVINIMNKIFSRHKISRPWKLFEWLILWRGKHQGKICSGIMSLLRKKTPIKN